LRGEGQGGGETLGDDGPEWHFAPSDDGTLPQIALRSQPRPSHTGTRRAGPNEGNRGSRIGARPAGTRIEGSLALDATIRVAARFQPQRRQAQCAQESLSDGKTGKSRMSATGSAIRFPRPPGEGQGEEEHPHHPTTLIPAFSQREGEERHGRALRITVPVGEVIHPLLIRRQDWMLKLRCTPTQHLYILVVDSSGSMAAYQRMAQVKGVLLGLLREVYRHRDGVAVIAFRGVQSELLLAPTRSPEAAQAFLEALPTGGRTPLPHALVRVETILTNERRRRSSWEPILVLVTDGRPNRGLTRSDPLRESLSICHRLAQSGLRAVVVDTEVGAIRLGLASQFASALSGAYVRLEQLLRGRP
jgi:Mg-chelatase subunit ChlD